MTMMGEHTLPPEMPEVLVRSDPATSYVDDGNNIIATAATTTTTSTTTNATNPLLQSKQQQNHAREEVVVCLNCVVFVGVARALYALGLQWWLLLLLWR